MRVSTLPVLSLCLACLLGAGCASSPPPGGRGGLPTMDVVKPRQPVYPRPRAKARPSSTGSKPALRIYKLDMPVGDSTAKAWRLVDQKALPALTRTVWAANGLRLGIISSQRLGKLRDALPRITAVSQAKVYAPDQYIPIVESPRLPDPIHLDLTVPPHPVKEAVVRSGRMKLLMRAERGRGGGTVSVQLVPHQYIPRLSLKPRPAREKVLDGHTFETLSMSVALASNQILVIGLDRPWDKPPPPQQNPQKTRTNPHASTRQARANTPHPSPARASHGPDNDQSASASASDTDADADAANPHSSKQEDSDDKKDKNALPPIGHHLGRALLTRRRATHPLQTLLLIRVANGH